MLQYNVPQFVDQQDEVIGPLTIKQFMFLVIGTVITGLLWPVTPNIIFFFIFAVPVILLSIMFAFVKIRGQTFFTFVINVGVFFVEPQLFLWSRDPASQSEIIVRKTVQKTDQDTVEKEKEYSQQRVEEIAWVLDTYGEKSVETAQEE
jgi:hypothetical protein